MGSQSGVQQKIEQVYLAWDKALSERDIDAIMGLYASNATIETPLIVSILQQENGVCTGKEEIRSFLEKVFKRTPESRKFFKKNLICSGNTVMCEYPRETSESEQLDIFVVAEIENDLIVCQRIYWGWKGFNVLKNDSFRC